MEEMPIESIRKRLPNCLKKNMIQNFLLRITLSQYLNTNEYQVVNDTHVNVHVPHTLFSKFHCEQHIDDTAFSELFHEFTEMV